MNDRIPGDASSSSDATPGDRLPRLLITAGPTREYIDDVRYLSNAASGRLGIEVARVASEKGWDVCLLLGPTPLDPPEGVECHRFVSAEDLDRISGDLWSEVDALVATAAVMDYRPKERIPGKRKKTPGSWNVELVRNPDVLACRSRDRGGRVLVGCSLEASLDRVEARRKLETKNLDLILLNQPANLDAPGGTYVWIPREGAERQLDDVSKEDIARKVVDFLAGKVMVHAPE